METCIEKISPIKNAGSRAIRAIYTRKNKIKIIKIMSKEECYIKTNGCSVPGGLPFFYKTTFTPACVKHDVCYSCVRIQKSVIAYQTTYTTRSHKCFLYVSLFLSRMQIGLIEVDIKTLVVYHLQEVFGK